MYGGEVSEKRHRKFRIGSNQNSLYGLDKTHFDGEVRKLKLDSQLSAGTSWITPSASLGLNLPTDKMELTTLAHTAGKCGLSGTLF